MVRLRRQSAYKYEVYQDEKLIAYIFRGGDARWRIFAAVPLPFDDSTIYDVGYEYLEIAVEAFTKNIEGSGKQ